VAQNTTSITVELFVAGQITPSQGDYIIALNDDTPTGDINANSNEPEGEPELLEAYGQSVETFGHWDQAFIYGNSPSNIPNCTPNAATGFSYCWKAVSTSGGQNVISFVPIILAPNNFVFNPAGNYQTGNGNAMEITLPINCLSLGGSQTTVTCGTGGSVVPVVSQVYVNLITIDTTATPQDQLACLAASQFTVPLNVSGSYPLVKPAGAGCATPPNPNLQIIGGEVVVHVAGSSLARLIDASPNTSQTLALTANGSQIDSGITAASPTAPYAKVAVGSVRFAAPPTSTSSTVTIAPATDYTLALEGEPSSADYGLFPFVDKNPQASATTVRFKVNNAAPDLSTAVDVYVWLSTGAIPATPTVADLPLNQDSGSIAGAPGDSYIPMSSDTTTVLPTGTYDVAVVHTGSTPNGSSDLFDGSAALSVGNSYSITIADAASGAANAIEAIGSVDQPPPSTAQSNLFAVARHPLSLKHP
jgi:hypothetical protein